MKVAKTGSSKLALAIKVKLQALNKAKVRCIRIEDIIMNDTNCWIFDKENSNHIDVLINNAHQDFEQTKILDIAHRAWKDDDTKHIINISSRASQPNISKGHMYASQKASLNHMSNNLTYNSDRKYKITTMNLGLLEHDLPSLSYGFVAQWISDMFNLYSKIEIPEITLQAFANYRDVQQQKEKLCQ